VNDKGLAEQAQAPSLGLSHNWPSNEANTDKDTGALDVWDLHVGLKPSPLDNCASDTEIEIEETLPYGAESEVSGIMVDMMVDLDNCDVQDMDWLPLREKRKLAARKTGMIRFCLETEISRILTGVQGKERPIITALMLP